MLLLKTIKMVSLLAALMITAASAAENFRTPAKRYGAAYSVKLTLKKGMTEYVTTMWVKPDQAESTLDYNQMRDLGWSDALDAKKPFMTFDDVSLVGTPIEKVSFKNQKSEWAYVPEFAKSCCYGVIGRDILNQYKLKFVPKNPAAIEWTKVDFNPKAKVNLSFVQSLASLFSYRSESGSYRGKKMDLSETSYSIDLAQSQIAFEPAPISKAEKDLKPRAQSIFSSYFIPPARKLQVESVSAAVAKSAKKVGFKPGMHITHINDQMVAMLDQFDVQALLRGKRALKLVIEVDKQPKPFTFDFSKGEFVE